MEFPVTIDSQEAFDEVIRERLGREKTKQGDLQAQVDQLTAEKQDIASQLVDLTGKADAAEARAASAESWRVEREAADAADVLRTSIAAEFGVEVKALRGDSDESLREHAQILKDMVPAAPVIPNIGDSPSGRESAASEFAADFFGSGN